MEKIETAKAPAAIGPYSQAVRAGDYLFCSGQIPLIPETGEMVAGGVVEQTRQVLDNLMQVLAAAGADFGSVVKTTIYLADLADFVTVNEIYAEYCAEVAPARATVQVAALPKGARVEIDAVACFGK
ncbi:RidA family protein [Malonomonas rubra]|uniref:RidA family protein n=1 Tax=Malonomonas rubra TaxID=57040 RepID=UPI0026EEF899|nr:RidA family protein [Malonomonas rubra]